MANSEEDKSSQSVDVIGINLAELKAALLGGIERMEAILQEAESTASHEAQQYEELRQRTEVKVGLLETQLREMEGSLRSKESTINLLKEDLNSKTQELEKLVTEKENLSSLLEKHNSEIALLRSGTEGKVGLLETQLQEMEESLRLKESAINLLEENLTSKIQELNHLVTEKESLSSLLEKHNSAIALLRSETEAKVGLLEAQLQEREKALRKKESSSLQLEESLTSKVQELEHLVTEKENLSSLLEKHNSEIAILRSQMEAKVGLLEAQLQEREESLRSKESAIKQLGESFTSKVQELEHLVTEKENLSSLLEKHNSAIALLRSETEAKVGLLEAQLQEREKALRKKESSSLQLEESFTAEIQGLEEQLGEKESLLESRQADLNDLRSKLDELTGGSQDIVTLREEDVVTINLLDHSGEKGITSAEGLKGMAVEAERLRGQIQERDAVAKQQEDILTARIHDLENRLAEKEALLEKEWGKDLQESMAAELERLRADLRDRNLLLEARETEVRMIKQSVQEKFRGLEKLVQRPQGGEEKKSPLVSFLATVEKKH
jgi:chromosome segregation ATPase